MEHRLRDLKISLGNHLSLTSIFGERWILDRKQADAALVHLLDELERAEADGVQVEIESVETDVGDAHLLALVVRELPQRQQRAVVLAELIRWIFPVAII